MAKRPPTKGRRLLKLASMTAGVASDFAGSKVRGLLRSKEQQEEEARALRRRAGERVAETLGELKGAAMKVGQFASAAKEILPPEVADALSTLQKSAPPMDYEVIEQQIRDELGEPPEILFQRFEPEPFAAASVGQVHRARTDDGREVVVKVQYPGVDGAVDSDLSQVKMALRLGGLVKVEKRLLDAVFDELRGRLHEELDYCNEADNVRLFRDFHRRHPKIIVPQVVGERSSQRVLTMTYEYGAPLAELGRDGVGQPLRDAVGLEIGRLIVSQLFELKTIHADPNPANFAYRPDGALVVYDFGCAKSFTDDFVQIIRDILRAADARDYPELDRTMVGLGPLRPAFAPVPPDYYDRWLDCLCPPLWEEGLYDFGAADIMAEIMRLVPGVVKRQHWFQPAPDLVMLDRQIGGLYDIARAAKVHMPLRQLLLPHMTPS